MWLRPLATKRGNGVGISDIFSFGFKSQKELAASEIEEIFPLAINKEDFVKSDILHTYSKILTDVIERTHGLKEEFHNALWDNCLQNESSKGLITLIAEAMTAKADLFLVYKALGKENSILRLANAEEQKQIREDYKAGGESKVGIYVSFKKYRRTEMLEIYSNFEHCVLGSLNKSLNISDSIQIKINELRSSTSLADSGVAVEQAKNIAEALRNGNDVLLDKNDEIVTAAPDTSASENSTEFLDAKRAFILDLPLSYITGAQTPGMGSSGENDMRAVERGLKQYYVSIVKPILKALFGADTEFKSQDFRQMTTALEVLKAFELSSDTELMSMEAKQEIIARVFDLDPDKERKAIDQELADKEDNPPPELPPGTNPANNNPPSNQPAPPRGNA